MEPCGYHAGVVWGIGMWQGARGKQSDYRYDELGVVGDRPDGVATPAMPWHVLDRTVAEQYADFRGRLPFCDAAECISHCASE